MILAGTAGLSAPTSATADEFRADGRAPWFICVRGAYGQPFRGPRGAMWSSPLLDLLDGVSTPRPPAFAVYASP